jgi:putative peptidoglycan lipid II flippase
MSITKFLNLGIDGCLKICHKVTKNKYNGMLCVLSHNSNWIGRMPDSSAQEPNALNKDNAHVTQAAGVVGLATLLSRILGYVRDMVMASLFGAGLASDAFIAAFRIPNMLRRLFGEGSLSIAFVPVFTDCLNHQGRKEAERLAASALRLVAVTLALVAAVGILFSPVVVRLLAYGFTAEPEKYLLCIRLTRIMMPYLLFVGLVAMCMGILNVLGHFAAPALAPTMLNVAMIGTVFLFSWFSPSKTTRIVGLALGVLVGGGLQVGLQIPFLIQKGIRFWRSAPLWHPAMKQVLQLMGPAVFGAAVYQINSLVICLLGSLLPQGSITYLYFADRLVQFPLGLFATAMATAVLPTLARQATKGEWDSLRSTFSHAIRLIFFITLPSMAGLIILREPIVAILFEHGAFASQSARLTASALLYYGIGLWAFSSVRILIYTFYALKDTRTPVAAAVVAIVANIVLGVLLMGPMKHNGLALALSLASMLHVALLCLALRKKLGALGWRRIALSTANSCLCTVAMSWCVWALSRRLIPTAGADRMTLAFGVVVCIAAGVIVFIIAAMAVKAPELDAVKQLLLKRTQSK